MPSIDQRPPDDAEPDPSPTSPARVPFRWLRRCGAVALLFFVLKGLAWLGVPAVLAFLASRASD